MSKDKDKNPIIYYPDIVVSLKSIRERFGTTNEYIFRWIDEGAPIACIKLKCNCYYSTEAMRLQTWLEERSKQK